MKDLEEIKKIVDALVDLGNACPRQSENITIWDVTSALTGLLWTEEEAEQIAKLME